jgi:hypothetical protein
MFSQARLRTILRGGHIVEGIFLAVYVYSPFHLNAIWTGIARFVVLPLLVLSGAWMWQQGRIARWMRGTRSQTKHEPAMKGRPGGTGLREAE